MRVVLVSDTHVPSRASTIPEWVADEVRAADHVVHAGDYDSPEAYETVAEMAPSLTAVHGNVDPDLGLPATASVELGGVEFVVTHGTGSSDGWAGRVADAVARTASADGPAVGVAGHTHTVTDVREGGVRILNPGSATGADPATETSIMVADVADGRLDVDVLRE